MTAVAIPLDQWELRFHEAMAALLRARDAIRRQAGILGLAPRFWSVARDLKNLTNTFEVMLAAPDGVLDEAALRSFAERTSRLVREIRELIDVAKRRGLTNRTLTAGSLNAIRLAGEKLDDYLDVLELSTDPEVEKLIREGKQDFADGRGVSLESLRQE